MIRLVVALREEALALVERFALNGRPATGLFPVFESDGVMLAISGVGRDKAAAAVAYLHTLGGERPQCAWLNVGVAGHRSCPPGTLLVANRISNAAGRGCWYPPQTLLSGCTASELICVDEPETSYPREALYDMESAGYYPIARRCATSELVHCVKIVSDGPGHHIGLVTGTGITRLIEDQADKVVQLAMHLDTVAAELAQRTNPHAALEQVASACGASATQRHQLQRLLRRMELLAPGQQLLERALAEGPNARNVIARLRAELDALPVELSA